jgi:transcriptional regulator with XRE-family HTH domain
MVKNVQRVDVRDLDVEASPNPTDLFVGARLRMRRLALGHSMEEVALMIGVTPERLHAFECGNERVGAPRLFQFSQVLSVPVAWFFEGIGRDATPEFGGRMLPPQAVSHEALEKARRELLIFHYDSIDDEPTKALLLEIARTFSDRSMRKATAAQDRH